MLRKHLTLWIAILVVLNLVMLAWAGSTFGVGLARTFGVRAQVPGGAGGQLVSADQPVLAADLRADPNLVLTCSQDSYSTAVAAVRPAVVSIAGQKAGQDLNGGALPTAGPYLDGRPIEGEQLGTGIIVDPRGYILTNRHIVAGASGLEVQVFSAGEPRYSAQVVYEDKGLNLAILRTRPGSPLPSAVLGNSDMVEVGDVVLAIGSPFGLEQTVTMGIISDTKRTLRIQETTYREMMQTDAAINRGNSGGPLLNIQGEVIGINTAIYAPTGVFSGIGFAIPINQAKGLIVRAVYGDQ
jgi:serine protease Do